MTGQTISVVVPFYNNAELLGACLASIAAQTHADLEVIMVDDGSTDGSADVARAQAAADARFRLVSVPNGGPGWARNQGVAAASGEFLAFVDADDLLPPDAYSTLLAVLERSGSDFVSGGVLRLTADGLGQSGLHSRAIKARKIGTHIGRSPELFYDISVWNKLFRKSFWDAADMKLPEGMVWEDLVAMTRAHVVAGSVDVITDPIYHWRDRDRGDLSITQSRTDIGNLRDRITALGMIDEFLRARATADMLRQHQHKALVNDLWLYVRDLALTDEGYQSEFVALTAEYLRQVSPEVIKRLPATHKLAYYLIEHGRRAELADLASWLRANPGRTPPMVRVLGRLQADLPLRKSAEFAIPRSVFRPHWRDLDPYVRVDSLSWHGDSLVIEGSAYVPSMDIGRRRSTTKLVVLVPRGRRRPPIVLPARSVQRTDVTEESGQDRYRYDWAGLRCEVPARLFRSGRRWLTGDWDCYVLVRGGAVWRPARLHSPGPDAESPVPREIAPGLTLGARWAGGRLQLRLRPGQAPPAPGSAPPVRAEQSWGANGTLVVHGRLPAPVPGLSILLRHANGFDRYAVPVGLDDGRAVPAAGPAISAAGVGGAAEAADFAVAIPVGAMDVFGDRRPLRDGRWQVSLRDGDGGGEVVPCHFTVRGSPARIGRKVYRCVIPAEAAGTSMDLSVGPALGIAERGRIRRRLMRDTWYRAQRLLGVREAILFSSFHGKQCGDSPRAIADELGRRGDSREQIWAVSDWAVAVPEGARAVLIGSAAYFAALGRSRYIVANDHVPLPYRKRPGQRHVQTWHGTPLKRLGFDIANPQSASGRRYLDYLAHDVAQWDMLLSPNPFSTPIMREAFRFRGEICETGYPRDDAVVAPPPGRAEEVRLRLGLPAGKRVAMYVPTWRDNLHDADGRYLLDFRLDVTDAARRLADDFVLLIRGHHLMAGGIPGASSPGFAFDVTGYPDISDLLLITDVLITDYSSVMFDFAPTGRPMLFFTYDLEQYRDQIRGFYFDFEQLAPGPLLATSDEVVGALAELDSVADRYKAAHATFTTRFCPLDDGKASARACDRIFGG
jgi:CDP-glycerol glycerophosphotransferase (TagB/SpsB family)/glycosyltransferase involved in cell wall biosynthesis